MPTFKHPCPQCDTFIERTVEACPNCGFARPFSADAASRVKPRQATSLPKAAASAAASAAPAAAARAPAATASAPAAQSCTGCGAALPAGARFCQECGTLTSA